VKWWLVNYQMLRRVAAGIISAVAHRVASVDRLDLCITVGFFTRMFLV
jgi:hypothetical protein